MNSSLRELDRADLDGVAGGDLPGGLTLLPIRLRPLPTIDLRFKPEPDPWRIVVPGG